MNTNNHDSESEHLFLRLSTVLTSLVNLESGAAHAHFKVAKTRLGSKLDDVLAAFAKVESSDDLESAVGKQIFSDSILGPSAQLILLLWYNGGVFIDPNWQFDSAGSYYGGLVWRAIGAHPPGLSNAYYGHWKYPAET